MTARPDPSIGRIKLQQCKQTYPVIAASQQYWTGLSNILQNFSNFTQAFCQLLQLLSSPHCIEQCLPLFTSTTLCILCINPSHSPKIAGTAYLGLTSSGRLFPQQLACDTDVQQGSSRVVKLCSAACRTETSYVGGRCS